MSDRSLTGTLLTMQTCIGFVITLPAIQLVAFMAQHFGWQHAFSVLAIGPLFEEHRGFLWSLCYRMTGSAADADDVVQDAFVRAMERPPRRIEEPLRPWLVKVALKAALVLIVLAVLTPFVFARFDK